LRGVIPDESYPYLAQMADITMKKGYDEDAEDGLERVLKAVNG